MRKYAAVAALLLWAGLGGFSQQKQEVPPEPEFKIPPEEARRQNPVKPTPGSIAMGRHLYSSQCAMCHGARGDGKGDLALEMKFTLRDYRDPAALKGMTDGELFYILTKGKGKMLGQEDRLTLAQKWNLINFIRSLARKEPATKPATKKN